MSSTTRHSPEIPGPRPVSQDDEAESWSLMNRRRAELIFKKNRESLDDEERSELERLQELSRSRMQAEFPAPALIDDRLKKIEAGIRSARIMLRRDF